MPIPKRLDRAINKFRRKDARIAKKLFPYVSTPGDNKLYILAQSGRGNTAKYVILGILDEWTAEFREWNQQTLFSVSTTREDFGKDEDETFYQILKRSTHIAKSDGEIYRTRNGDSVQIYFLDFAYKIYGVLEGQKTFDPATDAVMET